MNRIDFLKRLALGVFVMPTFAVLTTKKLEEDGLMVKHENELKEPEFKFENGVYSLYGGKFFLPKPIDEYLPADGKGANVSIKCCYFYCPNGFQINKVDSYGNVDIRWCYFNCTNDGDMGNNWEIPTNKVIS